MSIIYNIKPLSVEGWNALKDRIDELQTLIEKERAGNQLYIAYQKEMTFFSHLNNLYTSIIIDLKSLDELEQLYNEESSEMRILIKEEINELNNCIDIKKNELLSEIFPVDKEEKLSVFLEIRAGTGGLEASLFAKDLVKMYHLYSQKKGWNCSCVDISETELGGIREVILHIEGRNVFGHLRYESGVHRVQRVPDTEGAGRVHTSTATVAILPEVDDIEVTIEAKDLRVDTYRASGAGGQHINKTDSAIRITHIPTGIVVSCQDERSQHKNRAKAMKVLQARIYAEEKNKVESKVSQMRKEMVSSAERADKIRTYNYPQNRITDHRIGLTINRLEYIVKEGDLEEMVEALKINMPNNRSIHPLFESLYKQYFL